MTDRPPPSSAPQSPHKPGGGGNEAAKRPDAPRRGHGAAKFLEGSLLGHVSTMTWAASLGLLAVFLSDLADLYFISLLGQAELAAAVGFAGAITFLTMSISIGLAIAMGALVARTLGSEDTERARLYATHVLIASLIVSAAFAALLWSTSGVLLAWVGATGETAAFAETYLDIVLPSMPFMTVLMMGGALLRAHGDARRSMLATLSAALINALLDPLFIFGFGWGLEGAALATFVARVLAAVVALWPIVALYGGFARVRRAAFFGDMREIFSLAAPAMLTNVSTPIGAAYITRAIADYGDDAVAGYAIVGRLTPVAFAAVFAVSGAIGPIVAQNFGARRYDRVRGALSAALGFLAVYTLGASLLLFLLRDPLIAVFGATGEGATLMVWFCGPLALLFFFNGVLYVANASFNNLGHPLYSTGLNWGRHTLGTIPVAMAGGHLLGAPGVLLGQALGGVAFGAVAVWLAYRTVEHQARIDAPERAQAAPVWRRPQWMFSPHRD